MENAKKVESFAICVIIINVEYFPYFGYRTWLHFQSGAAKGLCIRKGYINPKWFVPSFLVVYQSALIGLVIAANWGLLSILAIPFVLYWIINIAVCLQFFKRRILAALLPATFWIFHSAIGLGFLAGVFLGRKSFTKLQIIRKTVKRKS